MPDDYVSFESALRELQLTAEQLKRLVSEGEIRAIRGEQNSMKFRTEEIQRLKQDTGKTVQFTEPSSETLTDDLLFDESGDLDVADEGAATAQITSSDTIPAKDKGGRPGQKGPGKPAPAAKKPSPAAAKTTTVAAASSSATSQVRRTTGRSTRITQAHAELSASGIGVGIVITSILTAMLMVYVSLVMLDSCLDRPQDLTKGLADFCVEKFGK